MGIQNWDVASRISGKVKAPKAEICHGFLTWSRLKKGPDCHRRVYAQPPVESYTWISVFVQFCS